MRGQRGYRQTAKDGSAKEAKPRKPPSAINTAIRLLSRRDHSKHELRKKLLEREIDPELADAAIERLQSVDLQSDQRFVNGTIRMKSSAGQGPRRIMADLGQHRLEEGLIDIGMEAAEVDWEANAKRIVVRRFGEGKLDFKTRNKAMHFLLRRGFDMDMARKAIEGAENDGDEDGFGQD